MTETAEILAGTVAELEQREAALKEEIERVQTRARVELRDVQKALRAIRKHANGAVAPPVEEPEADREVDDEDKQAILRVLAGGKGMRVSAIARECELPDRLVSNALQQLVASGDLETYGRGLYREKGAGRDA